MTIPWDWAEVDGTQDETRARADKHYDECKRIRQRVGPLIEVQQDVIERTRLTPPRQREWSKNLVKRRDDLQAEERRLRTGRWYWKKRIFVRKTRRKVARAFRWTGRTLRGLAWPFRSRKDGRP